MLTWLAPFLSSETPFCADLPAALQNVALIDANLFHGQICLIELEIILGIGHCRIQKERRGFPAFLLMFANMILASETLLPRTVSGTILILRGEIL